MDNAELDRHIEKLKRCEYINDINAVKRLCDKAKEILSKTENVVYLNAPITVRTKNLLIFIMILILFIDMWRYSWPIL
jgi:hypothetical protein